MALRWFRGYFSRLCSLQGFFGFLYRACIVSCRRLSGISIFSAFMPDTGARPKAAKINLMDCSCLCSEFEILLE